MSGTFSFPPPPPPPAKATAPPANYSQHGYSIAGYENKGFRGNRGGHRGRGRNFGAYISQGGHGGAYGQGLKQSNYSQGPHFTQPNFSQRTNLGNTFSQANGVNTDIGKSIELGNGSQIFNQNFNSAQPYGQTQYTTTPAHSNPMHHLIHDSNHHNDRNRHQYASFQPTSEEQQNGSTIQQPSVPTSPANLGVNNQYHQPAREGTYHCPPYNSQIQSKSSQFRPARAYRGPPVPRQSAAPAVPNFIPASLQLKPPKTGPEYDNSSRNRKRRKSNMLGLTPKGEEHVSSEDEEDEETKLAVKFGQADQLQFTYKGRTSTLGSAKDIAAWIEERRKRFPTKRRIEEKLLEQEKRREEFKKRKEESQKVRAENWKAQEQNIGHGHDQDRNRGNERKRRASDLADEARHPKRLDRSNKNSGKKRREKVKEQAERIRVLEEALAKQQVLNSAPITQRDSSSSSNVGSKEEDNAVNAVRKRKRDEVDSVAEGTEAFPTLEISDEQEQTLTLEPRSRSPARGRKLERSSSLSQLTALTASLQLNPHLRRHSFPPSTSKIRKTAEPSKPETGELPNLPQQIPTAEIADFESGSDSDTLSSISDDTEDSVSSSGSSDIDMSDDSAPEAQSTKNQNVFRVPPPRRERTRESNRKRPSTAKRDMKFEKKSERISLYQRLLNQDRAKERELVLQAIQYLGDSGVLDEPKIVEADGV